MYVSMYQYISIYTTTTDNEDTKDHQEDKTSTIGNLKNQPIYIPPTMGFPPTAFSLPSKYLDSKELKSVVLTEGFIEDRVEKMARELLGDIIKEHHEQTTKKKEEEEEEEGIYL